MAALEHGGGDNVSIIVIEAEEKWFLRRGPRLAALGAATVLVAVLLWLLL
jgi:hypothetical protein